MFKFKLQSVLEYRRNVEERVQGEFSEFKRYLEEQKAVLSALVKERKAFMEDLRSMQRGSIRADDIAALVAYVEVIREKETAQMEVIRKAQDDLEKKRLELIDAVKNRKVMESLREKHEEEYRKHLRETEQKHSDEMAVLKFGRRLK
jgi:flagellar FliJ protein